MSEAAFEAIRQAREARLAGETDLAQRLVGRAQRLAFGNPSVILALALEKRSLGNGDAVDLFTSVLRKHDTREAWLGLASAWLLKFETDQAVEALRQALRHHAFPTNLTPAADMIAHAVGAVGWCALTGAGNLLVRLTHSLPPGVTPHATLDERSLALRARSGRLSFAARLPDGWRRAGAVMVRFADEQLLGSPISVTSIVRVEGFVDSTNGDLHGWAWCPNHPEQDPILSIGRLGGRDTLTVVAANRAINVLHERPLARPRGFQVSAAQMQRFHGLVQVCGHDGRELIGSPLDPSAERRSAQAASRYIARLFPAPGCTSRSMPGLSRLSVPAHVDGSRPRGGTTKRAVDVIVPVYGKLDLTLSCLESVLTDLPRWARVVVVDDASPDSRISQELGRLAARRHITLLAQPLNRGFPSTANVGMRHDPERDVVLLNSDTLVPPDWLSRLRDSAYVAGEVGTASPLSNDATILSYPSEHHENPIPDLAEMIRLDAWAQRANARRIVDIPTGVGFCMYVKRDCLNDVGLFREDTFAQGYGEENDFCMRARHLGWRHVAAPGIFVAHVGGQSFGPSKRYLIERNSRRLNLLHPGYDELIREFQAADPLSESRRRLDMVQWKRFRSGTRSVLLVTHDRGGGVQRRVTERATTLRAEGIRPIILWPVVSRTGSGRECVLGDGPNRAMPNLRFAIPKELHLLTRLLKGEWPLRAEVHHLVGHDHALLGLFQRLNIPYEVIIHDYSWICPRISLIGPDKRYCGEPNVSQCDACVADAGSNSDEDISTRHLRERSLVELTAATRVIAPSQDAASRVQRHFPGVCPVIVPWEDDGEVPSRKPTELSSRTSRICVVGAIGIEKGYEMLLACARDAVMRDLKLEFCLVGHSSDDARLLATGRVHITGRYDEEEAVALISAQGAQLGWLPSLWPETWCYTLTKLWYAGLDVVAFDIGAPADRIRQTGRGWLCPLGLSPSALNNHLLRLCEPMEQVSREMVSRETV